MASYKIDLVDGADYQRVYADDGSASESASRIGIVSGFPASTTPATAMVVAMAMVESAVPKNTPYDAAAAPFCLARSYSLAGISGNDDAVRIRIGFHTPVIQLGGSDPEWRVEDDGFEETTSTQVDPKTRAPLWVRWEDPMDTKNVVRKLATVTDQISKRRLILQTVLEKGLVQKYRDNQGCVNQGAFFGLPTGHWKFSSFRTGGFTAGQFRKATVELEGKRDEDWATYAFLKSPDGNHIVASDANVMALLNAPYTYGVTPEGAGTAGRSANKLGVIKIGGRRPVNFSTLFKIVP